MLAVGEVPKARGLVRAGAGQVTAIGMKRDSEDQIRVAFERAELFAARTIPEPHRLVEAGGGKLLAVGAECDAGDFLGIAFERRAHGGGRRWIV